MNKTKIEWVKNPDGSPGYTFNPITGCLNGCPYCYARRLANGRLKQRYLMNTNLANGAKGGVTKLSINKQVAIEREGDYGNPFYPRFWPERLEELHQVMARMTSQGKIFSSSPKGIFVCDMGELFGDWIPKEWQEDVFECIKANSHHRFYILTKQPQNLIKWSPFPENCWVGVTATNSDMFFDALAHLAQIHATVKYISFEPLLSPVYDISLVKGCILRELGTGLEEAGVHWVIIGACTGTLNELKPLALKYPELEVLPYGRKWTLGPKFKWVEEIVEATTKVGIPVFLKNNLFPLLEPGEVPLRQEMPK